MEPEQRGRASRASSTSSLGREVRCGCQYYQSDSLLPERRALLVRPSSRTMQQPPAVRCSEHEYEPIAPPSSLPHPAMAPVVRIRDTDVMPVADSDDSIDDRGRLPPELMLGGDIILPLDGKIEDNAMEGRELGETGGDTSEAEQEPTTQQVNDRLNEQLPDAPTPLTECRTDGEVNTSQVDSSATQELPLQHGARGLPQRIKTQAGKLRKRLRSFQRPTFSIPARQKPDKTKSTSSGKSDKSRTEKRPSRMDRIRTSISEKTKFTLPDRPRFSLPDKSKFHLPERPKFSFPDKSRFHLPDKPKFNIKKPNIHLPSALTRAKRPPSLSEQQQQYSIESTAGSKRNIFDFSTYPRIFDRKSKKRTEYATSSPKDSRAQSTESATFPRPQKRKALSARLAQRFGDSTHVQSNYPEAREMETAIEPAKHFQSWHHPSLEEARLSARTEEEIMAADHAIPWEDARNRGHYDEREIQYMDYEQESSEMSSDRHPHPSFKKVLKKQEEEYEREEAIEIDPRLYGDQEPKQENDVEKGANEWCINQQAMVPEEKFRPIPRSRSLDEEIPRIVEQEGYEGAFIDPRRFRPRKMASDDEEEEEELEEGEEEHEPYSAQSDREQQQSSGSSCDRRRRGVIEEIDSDEFFLRERGISEDDMNLGRYLTSEIRDALRSEGIDTLADEEIPPTPPQRPMRMRSLRKRKEESLESNEMIPPARPKRERTAARRSREASIMDDVFRERTRSDSRSDSRHHIVYQAEGDQQDPSVEEPLDDIVVVKPARRKSKASLRSQSQPPMETSILSPSAPTLIMHDSASTPFLSTPPVVPIRRKRSHREAVVDQRNGDVMPICNGHREWETEVAFKKSVTPRSSRSRQSLVEQFITDNIVLSASQEDIVKLEMRFQQENFMEPIPIPPKRRSRSRTTSVAADEDRTSHGAESLPEAGYIEEDIPRDEIRDFAHDLSGYAIVEKREKPPRPPPPRRRRKDKFATTPRPTAPKRPQRAYSTLGPAKSRDTSTSGTILSETIIISTTLEPTESMPYIEIGSDDEHRDLRSGEVLNKIQGRPLPAPPRPPRARKEHAIIERPRTPFEFAMETTAATQTDPLPDDMVIEEEITQAKLTVTPSRSGSQVMVSMERIPSPTRIGTPPVPPLPMSQLLRKEDKEEIGMAFDTVSLTSPSPIRETDIENKHFSSPHLEEHATAEEPQSRFIKSTLLSDEPLRISSLEVGDLKVDRLSVSQIEAHKIIASEVDAMVITASELRNVSGGSVEESLSPAIIRELIAIRSHLETVATSQIQEKHHESQKELASSKITDIPTTDDSHIKEQEQSQEYLQEAAPSEIAIKEPASMEDEKIKTSEDQKVINTDTVDVKEKEMSHILSVTQVKSKDIEYPLLQTFAQINQLESKDKDDSINHLLTIAQDTQDKSLRILDSEHPLTLSSRTTSGPHMVESRASFPSMQPSEPRVSPERVNESPSSSVQTTEPTATSVDLHGSKNDVSISTEQIPRKSRSRSPSPSKGIVRQTASPVRSLPPVISVTPDVPDTTIRRGISMDAQPQRAIISYSSDNIPKDVQSQRVTSHSSDTEEPLKETQRGSSQSPIPSLSASPTHFIAFPASEIPAQFFSLSEPTNQRIDSEPGVIDTTQQLLRALRLAGIRAMKHFVRYLTSTLSTNNTREKIREVELVICALLLLIAGLLIYYFSSSHTVTHYHHWDYFNPPQ